MPFDIVGFGEATPGANGALAVGLLESFYTKSGDDLEIKGKAPYLLGINVAAEATGGGCSVSQPSLGLDYDFDVCSLLSTDDPGVGFKNLRGRPLPLCPEEAVNVTMDNAADEDAFVAMWLGDGKITHAMLDGVNPTHIIDGIGDTTMTAFTWGAVDVTWAQTLQAGFYIPVGMRYSYFKTTPAMPSIARLIFKEGLAVQWRPGVIGHESVADHEADQTSREHPFDMWPYMDILKFSAKNIPSVEVLSAEAHTDQNFQLLLQKVG